TEDFFAFERAPQDESVHYGLTWSSEVKGLRLVAGVLELLDEQGGPQLRMVAPFVLGADGGGRPIDVEVQGCVLDPGPGWPGGRPVTPMGAERCVVELRWRMPAAAYPAIVDPGWTATDSMVSTRVDHSAVTLGSGDVLVTCGFTASGS